MLMIVDDDEVFARCFHDWCVDNDAIDWKDPDSESQIRCAIVGFSHYVRHMLIDHYDVDIKEEGEI